MVQEDERKREERDERKRKYNVKWNDEVYHLLASCIMPLQEKLMSLFTPILLGYDGVLFSCRSPLKIWKHIE